MAARHGQRPASDNPYRAGDRVVYGRHVSLFLMDDAPAVVVRPATFCKTAIEFTPPLVLKTGAIKRGMIVQNKALRRVVE